MAVPAVPSKDRRDPVTAAVEASRVPERSSPPETSSSDSEEQPLYSDDAAQQDEANALVGVSIGRAQSRMKARRTPAEEKNRIMERNGGYFDAIPDTVDSDGLFTSQITAEPDTLAAADTQPPARKQSPKSALDQGAARPETPPAKEAGRSSFTRSILKSSLPLRPRAWSGDFTDSLRLKRFLPDLGSLGSLTKRSSLSSRGDSSQNRSRSQTLKPTSSKINVNREATPPPRPRRRSLTDQDRNSLFMDEPVSELQPLSGAMAAKHSYTRRPSVSVTGRPPSLRRSSSDRSLYLRASSTASSLDQRPEYENVHTQVNSRFKAIKDSLQDSSNRLLSMPTLHLQDLRNDWGYKPFLSDVYNRKGNNYAQNPEASADDSEAIPTAPPPRARVSRTNSNPLHPILSEAMSEMTGDVVIMGGYRGSILRSAKPPQRQLWVPMKVGLNLRKVDLEVGLDPEDEERMEETIIPSGVLSHIGPVDICRRLMKRLGKCDNALDGKLRVHDYGYDWRLSPHFLAKKLITFLENLPCNAPDVPPERRGAWVIAHSLGGLIARYAVNKRPELFAGVLYAGTPQHCVNILGPLRNGDDVLLSSRVLTAQVNFTFRTSFALLPEDGHCFINPQTNEEYRVDFFSAKAWDEYHLSPCINPALPPMHRPSGFVDNIGKRFSTVLSSKDSASTDEASQSESPPQPNGHHNPQTTKTCPDFTNNALENPTAINPPLEGAVGPVSNIRDSSHRVTQPSTIPRAKAMSYLERTLSETLEFKKDLAFRPSHQSNNRYPPAAVLYGKSVPTLYGARVSSREHIKHQDAYDDLAFAAGDGVCLASAAMLPPGYRIIRDGLVKSDRGHVGLLGDLEGVGQCLKAIIRGRREGVGMGKPAP